MTAARRGFLARNRWLLLRRLSQLLVLALFLSGPWFGVWIAKGNLASSLTLDVLPLTDVFVLAQSLAAGFLPAASALIGAAIVAGFYLLVGGRVYCAWVCPVNPVTDAAAWLRRRLGLVGSGIRINRNARFWILGASLLASAVTTSLAWEWLNPVSVMHRGLIFGFGYGWALIAGIFLFDLLLARHGWCGHLCPVGASYSLIGQASLLRVDAARRNDCDDCMDCYAVCPEPQVLRPALKGAASGESSLIRSAQCSNCGRCIDVCDRNVFDFASRFGAHDSKRSVSKMEVLP